MEDGQFVSPNNATAATMLKCLMRLVNNMVNNIQTTHTLMLTNLFIIYPERTILYKYKIVVFRNI